MNLKVGDKIRVHYGAGNLNNKIIHVRTVGIDDEWLVYRVWSERRQGWRYFVESYYYFEEGFKSGVYKVVK